VVVQGTTLVGGHEAAGGVGMGQYLGDAVGGGPRVSHRQDTGVVSDTVRVRESRLTGRTGPPR